MAHRYFSTCSFISKKKKKRGAKLNYGKDGRHLEFKMAAIDMAKVLRKYHFRKSNVHNIIWKLDRSLNLGSFIHLDFISENIFFWLALERPPS